MLKKTLATSAVILASAGVLLTAAPAAANIGTWTSNHDSEFSGNLSYINGLTNGNVGCGNSNAAFGQSLGSCFNTGVIIQD
ncbi:MULTISPECIES: hypothetical protein [Nocardiopsis]|uniref:hypothetical protein n=1 Tax=Nocardiopsis TaxID=2013 RepID=UPI0003648A57|nr:MULTISPECIES: hypothetical protein [Nocardiopsis]ASU56502.1 hypothetical protein CGQ36_02610 [Nocardiopsis dassonvillei]